MNTKKHALIIKSLKSLLIDITCNHKKEDYQILAGLLMYYISFMESDDVEEALKIYNQLSK